MALIIQDQQSMQQNKTGEVLRFLKKKKSRTFSQTDIVISGFIFLV